MKTHRSVALTTLTAPRELGRVWSRRVVADRYDLGELLGMGAHGDVWEATDRLTGETVAVKILKAPPGHHAGRVRGEIVALRLLQLPGVVRLLDEGVDEGAPFIATERVVGTPFPSGTRPWAEVAPLVESLLEILARVHAAGVVHRDLKPSNVLVGEGGRVTVLDFGVSFHGSQKDEAMGEEEMVGTPLYMAPEQIWSDPLSPSTDLYAVGIMIFEALSGLFPHEAGAESWLRASLLAPSPPLASVAPSAPGHVCALVDKLLERRPEDRPRTANEVLRWLRGEPPVKLDVLARLTLDPDGRYSEAALRRVFVGQERLLHIPEDAARVLHARTGGVPARVAAEISAWERAHLATWVGDRVAIDHDAIDRLDAGLRITEPALPREVAEGEEPPPARMTGPFAPLVTLILSGAGGGAIAAEASTVADTLAREGSLAKASMALAAGVRAIRSSSPGDPGALVPLFARWLEIAVVEEMPLAVDRVLYEICRVDGLDAGAAGDLDLPASSLSHLEALARAALAVLSAPPARAQAAVDAVAPFDDVALEHVRHRLRATIAERGDEARHVAVVADIGAWAASIDDPRVSASVAFWRGRLAYRRNDFAASARLVFDSAGEVVWMTERATRLTHAAGALLETFEHERASVWALAAGRLASVCRAPYAEARSELMGRCARYRAGALTEPDLELVAAMESLGMPDVEAQIDMLEATIAWRGGHREVARDLAQRAGKLWAIVGKPVGVIFARALWFAAGGELDAGELARLLDRARVCPVMGIGIQIVGLLALGVRERGGKPLACDFQEALCAGIPAHQRGHRIDALSVEEALAALGGGGGVATPADR